MNKYMYVAALAVLTTACQGPEKEERAISVNNTPEKEEPVAFQPPQVTEVRLEKPKDRTDFTRKFDPGGNKLDLRSLYRSLALKPQEFTINTNRDTILVGEKGTVLRIPARSFQTKDGLPYKGLVTFHLKECYDYADMLKENLSTMDGDVALESAGMIHTAALAGNDTLQLRPNSEVGIAFTDVKNYNEFDLYYGDRRKDGSINWELESYGCLETPVFNLTSGKYKNIYDDFFVDEYRLPKEDMLTLQGKPITFNASFSDAGEIIGYTFDDRTPVKQAACAEFIRVMKRYKQYDPAMDFQGWRTDFTFTSCGRDELLAKEMNQVMNIAVRNNMYYSRRLGWANCDRVPLLRGAMEVINVARENAEDRKYRDKMQTTQTVVVETGDEIETDVKIVYKGMKSIITPKVYGGTYVFKKLPEGQEAYVLATRCHAGKIYFTREKLVVSADEKPHRLNFKVYNHASQVKKELEDMVVFQN